MKLLNLQDLLDTFGTQVATAKAIGCTRQLVASWIAADGEIPDKWQVAAWKAINADRWITLKHNSIRAKREELEASTETSE